MYCHPRFLTALNAVVILDQFSLTAWLNIAWHAPKTWKRVTTTGTYGMMQLMHDTHMMHDWKTHCDVHNSFWYTLLIGMCIGITVLNLRFNKNVPVGLLMILLCNSYCCTFGASKMSSAMHACLREMILIIHSGFVEIWWPVGCKVAAELAAEILQDLVY